MQVRERKQLMMRDIYDVESALKEIVEALPAVNVIVSLLKSKGTMNDKELPYLLLRWQDMTKLDVRHNAEETINDQ